MTNIQTLARALKLATQKVDAKRLRLLKLESQHHEAQLRINKLGEEMQFERGAISNFHPSSITLEAYLKACKTKIREAEALQKDLQPQIEAAQTDLQKDYKDMKIIQTMFDLKIIEIKEIEKKKEQRTLDEIAQTRRKPSA